MKTISSTMQAHLLQGVTTLCTCLSVIRQDGAAFYFTDHDLPVTTAGQTYLPTFGYARASIPTSLELEVDTSSFSGVMFGTDAGAGGLVSLVVTREDIEAGLYDFANVYVFLANYADPSMAPLKIRRGWIGEIESTEGGSYTAELRGLTQVLAYKLGEAFTPECRADLGDARCKVPLSPARWVGGNSYNVGDTVLGAVSAADGYFALVGTNLDFEDEFDTNPSNAVPGWVVYGDSEAGFAQTDGHDSIQASQPPFSGDFYVLSTQIAGGESTGAGMTQDFNVTAVGITAAELDTGLCRFYGTVWAISRDNDGQSRVRFYALDDDDNVLGTIYDSGFFSTPTQNAWGQIIANNVLLPAGTRFIRCDLYATKKDSHQYGTGWDLVSLAVNTPDGTFQGASQFGDVSFQCTQAGVSGATEPAWTNLVGSTQVDGTAKWVCVTATRRVGTVGRVGGNRKSITSADLTDATGYYDAGILVWETGANAGRSMEITTWTGGVLSLFFRPYYPITPGDRFVVFPGCDKTRATCQAKFANIINFRGEPDVPGQDRYNLTPDAQTS